VTPFFFLPAADRFTCHSSALFLGHGLFAVDLAELTLIF
jgi:hypothetical protein